MKGDKTLIHESLTGKDLTEEEAHHLAEQMQGTTAAVLRFEALEGDLIEIVGVVNRIKKAVKWIIGLLIVNYGATFWDSIKSVIVDVIK